MKDDNTHAYQNMLSHAKEASKLLKLISNQQRLLVLCLLSDQELSVSALNEYLPGLSQSALSQHLAQLRTAKLVKIRRDSQHIYYSLTDSKAVSVINLLHSLYCKEHSVTNEEREVYPRLSNK